MSYVEIHFHLLPGVDDGPTSIEESAALAAAAIEDGTGTVVATPHINEACITDPRDVAGRVAELAERLRRERIQLDVLPGGELAHGMVGRLTHEQLDTIAQGPAPRRWLLLEAPFSGFDDSFTAATAELRRRGFAVVIAHPERAAHTRTTDAVIAHELEAGSVLQLNAWSLAGLNGDEIRRVALGLVRRTSRVVIASDAHGGRRTPALRLGLDALTAAGVRDPSRLAGAIPRSLLDDGLLVGRRAAAA
jgi:protein-tyrosine phosphatase